jgi:hypothetical protein
MTVGLIAQPRRGRCTKAACIAYGDVAPLAGISREVQQGPSLRLIGHSQGSLMLQTLIATKSRASRSPSR